MESADHLEDRIVSVACCAVACVSTARQVCGRAARKNRSSAKALGTGKVRLAMSRVYVSLLQLCECV
jgi:hypothetical protein